MNPKDIVFSPEQQEQLVFALLAGKQLADRNATATEREVETLLTWARMVRFGSGMLDAVLAGDAVIGSWDGKEPGFRLTPQGEQKAVDLVRQALAEQDARLREFQAAMDHDEDSG